MTPSSFDSFRLQSLMEGYDEVIEQLAGISSIFIFGPGEAKGEFKKRLEHKGMGELVAGCEPAERMTAHQITAKVQTFFHA